MMSKTTVSCGLIALSGFILYMAVIGSCSYMENSGTTKENDTDNIANMNSQLSNHEKPETSIVPHSFPTAKTGGFLQNIVLKSSSRFPIETT